MDRLAHMTYVLTVVAVHLRSTVNELSLSRACRDRNCSNLQRRLGRRTWEFLVAGPLAWKNQELREPLSRQHGCIDRRSYVCRTRDAVPKGADNG
jgi:hypothetical protein